MPRRFWMRPASIIVLCSVCQRPIASRSPRADPIRAAPRPLRHDPGAGRSAPDMRRAGCDRAIVLPECLPSALREVFGPAADARRAAEVVAAFVTLQPARGTRLMARSFRHAASISCTGIRVPPCSGASSREACSCRSIRAHPRRVIPAAGLCHFRCAITYCCLRPAWSRLSAEVSDSSAAITAGRRRRVADSPTRDHHLSAGTRNDEIAQRLPVPPHRRAHLSNLYSDSLHGSAPSRGRRRAHAP